MLKKSFHGRIALTQTKNTVIPGKPVVRPGIQSIKTTYILDTRLRGCVKTPNLVGKNSLGSVRYETVKVFIVGWAEGRSPTMQAG